MVEMNRYSFKIDGCLGVFNQSRDLKEATEKMEQAWPRSKVEYVGVNMDASNREMPAGKVMPKVRAAVEAEVGGMSVTEKSVVEAYLGH